MRTTYFHGDDVAPSAPEDALFHIIPVPLEQSVSYMGGTAAGPQAILEASCQLELLENSLIPSVEGFYTAEEVDCAVDIMVTLERIKAQVKYALECAAVPILLGGEHTLTLGAVQALQEQYGDDFAVVVFDAHADLRESYTGTRHSHACVMRRIHELGVKVYQFGTRSYAVEEEEYRVVNGIWFRDCEDIILSGVEALELPSDLPENIYLSFDVDVWDISLMPATGTPVPGGLDWYKSVWLLEKILYGRKCVGADFVELSPLPGLCGYDFVVAQLIHRVMSFIVE